MLRLLAIAALAILFWLLLDWVLNRTMRALGIEPSGRGGSGARRPPRAGASAQKEAEALVRCPACGIYVPASRALPVSRSSGLVACSEECRERLRAGARRP